MREDGAAAKFVKPKENRGDNLREKRERERKE